MNEALHLVGRVVTTWYGYTGISVGDALVLAVAAGILGSCITTVWERLNGAKHPTP